MEDTGIRQRSGEISNLIDKLISDDGAVVVQRLRGERDEFEHMLALRLLYTRALIIG